MKTEYGSMRVLIERAKQVSENNILERRYKWQEQVRDNINRYRHCLGTDQ